LTVDLFEGDCLDILPGIAAASVDLVFADPPYPMIKRDYGCMSEVDWLAMMQEVVRQSRRILKPSGSAVFILQPNSAKVGSMRSWLWRFMAWCCDEWNIVQDAYWWNIAALPTGEGVRRGMMKAGVKTSIWLGAPDCYKDRSRVMWEPAQATKVRDLSDRVLRYKPSGAMTRNSGFADSLEKNGGAVPFNVLPIGNTNSTNSAGSHGHGAGTPQALTDWWIRYLCPPGGVVVDPFMGSGTTGIGAAKYGNSFIGCEKMPKHFNTSRQRLIK
jgi:site-specific DNA-methyltransferase (adenine-specific)